MEISELTGVDVNIRYVMITVRGCGSGGTYDRGRRGGRYLRRAREDGEEGGRRVDGAMRVRGGRKEEGRKGERK